MSAPCPARVEFLGLAFDQWSMAEVEAWLAARDADAPFAYLVTPNVDHMVRFPSLPEPVREAYAAADLCLCDSRVLARLASSVGVDLPVVPGSDLSARLLDRVLGPGDRVCLIGGVENDSTTLAARYPGITLVQHCPPMGLRHDPAARTAAVEAALTSGARMILFAVGSPQQEMLAHEMAARVGARGTGLCIGASVDYLSGAQVRAPVVIQRLGMEWAWRLLSDPRRLARRYLVEDPAIIPMVWRWHRARRRRRG